MSRMLLSYSITERVLMSIVYFADLVAKRNLGYDKIKKASDCITDMATRMKINPYHASILLDGPYRGIDIGYKSRITSREN